MVAFAFSDCREGAVGWRIRFPSSKLSSPATTQTWTWAWLIGLAIGALFLSVFSQGAIQSGRLFEVFEILPTAVAQEAEQVESSVKAQEVAKPAKKTTVQITSEELEKFARLEAELLEREERISKLEQRISDLEIQISKLDKPLDNNPPGHDPPFPTDNGSEKLNGPVRRLLEGIAQNLDSVVQKELFCSAMNSSVGDRLTVRFSGKVRSSRDTKKAESLLKRSPYYGPLEKAGLLDVQIEADGGKAGGCVTELGEGVFLIKTSNNSFMYISRRLLRKEPELHPRIPKHEACRDIGPMLFRYREESGQVPGKIKYLFGAFWVREAGDFTLCRHHGNNNWESAALNKVNENWTGLVLFAASD